MRSVRQGAFATDGQLWRNHLSAQAKDLITKMLEVDPEKRITAREALEHPFFRNSAESSSDARAAPATKVGATKDEEDSNAAEVAAMRGVLIARTSQHLKTRWTAQNGAQPDGAAGGGEDGGGGWFASFWK